MDKGCKNYVLYLTNLNPYIISGQNENLSAYEAFSYITYFKDHWLLSKNYLHLPETSCSSNICWN